MAASNRDPRAALSHVQEEMFDVHGPFQCYLADHAKPLGAPDWGTLLPQLAITLLMDVALFRS